MHYLAGFLSWGVLSMEHCYAPQSLSPVQPSRVIREPTLTLRVVEGSIENLRAESFTKIASFLSIGLDALTINPEFNPVNLLNW